MATEQDAVKVVAALHGQPMGDRELSVKLADTLQCNG
ncbi:RNA recognition motif domain-containing protein [Mucilaginibacter sp. SP1R1]|nr:hypothetical protein [Mucilaginibacter sp. SP1R1]